MRKFRKITAVLLSVIIVVTCLVTSASAATETVSLTSGHAAAVSSLITTSNLNVSFNVGSNSGTSVRIQVQYMSGTWINIVDDIVARGSSRTYNITGSATFRIILSPVPASTLTGVAKATITY